MMMGMACAWGPFYEFSLGHYLHTKNDQGMISGKLGDKKNDQDPLQVTKIPSKDFSCH
jgi:hypothetical protein